MAMERFYTLVSRAEVTDSGVLSGYAAVYGVPTNRQSQFRGSETIARGAFDGLLIPTGDDNDTLMTLDHNPSNLLGRTSSGTLRLASDDHGLAFQLDLPNTSLGNDMRELVKRGDMRGASFLAAMDPASIERTASGVIHRKFTRLVDICLTAMPAYPETEVLARTAAEQSLRGQLASIRHRVRTDVPGGTL